MKNELDKIDRDALISYRISRAYDTIEEAKYNAKGAYFNTAVNRLYYAAYYAVTALLLKHHFNASTHAGVKTLFSLRFIKSGIMDIELGKTFMALFENRQSGDYEDFVYCDQELFDQLLPKTERLINCIDENLKSAGDAIHNEG